MTTSAEGLKETLKALMKRQGRTYADLAAHLGVSLPTVKRALGSEEMPLSRLLEVCAWLDVSLSDLEALAHLEAQKTRASFTLEQEEFLAANPGYLSYLAQLHDGDSPAKIAKNFQLTARSTELYLLRLERLELLHRDGKGRVRLAHRDFPMYQKTGPLIRTQYRDLLDRASGFFQRQLSRKLSDPRLQDSATLRQMMIRLSAKTIRQWSEKQEELLRELRQQAALEEKAEMLEDERFFVICLMQSSLAPDDSEVRGLKETLGRIVNL